jgi:glucose/arabinose dehydrogenase
MYRSAYTAKNRLPETGQTLNIPPGGAWVKCSFSCMTNPTHDFAPAALALLALVSLACGDSRRSRASADTAGSNASLAASPDTVTFPEGFRATVFADSIGLPRHMAVRLNGDLYVNTWRSDYDTARQVPPGGFIVALRDTNRDGKADRIERFGTERGNGGTGIALYKDQLYVEQGPAILRYRLSPKDLGPAGPPDTILTGLVTEMGHTAHPFTIDSEGNLFINSGSATNSCQVKDRAVGAPGERPCKELATRAGIWRYSSIRTGQRFGPDERHATGIRNAVGIAINPADGALYSTQHGRDQLAENWPKLFNWEQSAELPAEELLLIVRGGDYGWPYCYYDREQEKLVLAPEYGGDGKQVGECAQKLGPAAAYPGHLAPNALVFYSGSQFPEKYRGGAFIAFHGSWNRAPEPQAGYNVVFQPFSGGKPTGGYEVFADGFAGPRKQPGTARHRPAGLAVAPDGALYISDDTGGWIWRVVHGGD